MANPFANLSDEELMLILPTPLPLLAKLIIQPGTTIVSDIAEKGALCIERGAQLIAEGTATKPIVFTSGRTNGEKQPGDWGGIVILGRAKTNRTSEPTIEGGIGRPYGGTNDLDNSGVLFTHFF